VPEGEGPSGHVEADSPAPVEHRPEPSPTPQAAPPAPKMSGEALREPGEATLVLMAEEGGAEVVVSSPRGKILGAFSLQPGQSIALQGPPGEYIVRSRDGTASLLVSVVRRARVRVSPQGFAQTPDQ